MPVAELYTPLLELLAGKQGTVDASAIQGMIKPYLEYLTAGQRLELEKYCRDHILFQAKVLEHAFTQVQ